VTPNKTTPPQNIVSNKCSCGNLISQLAIIETITINTLNNTVIVPLNLLLETSSLDDNMFLKNPIVFVFNY
jgi:hypothetical protein